VKQKKALITGITGQDGAYLAEFLLEKGYEVHGIKRRASLFNTARIDHLYHDPHEKDVRFFMHYGDLTDSTNLIRIIHYQASTSELYGKVREVPQTEQTPFYPRSPYGCAKLYAYWCTVNYREAYGIFAANGILFNHESPIRGETFVTRKITRAAARIASGIQDHLYLGNLDAKRDWGHARDYVRAQWLILQQDEPDDYVIATGVQHSVREFCEKAFADAGIKLKWEGSGIEEKGIIDAIDFSAPLLEKYDKKRELKRLSPGMHLISVDPSYFRPADVVSLVGDASKAREKLGWEPRISFDELVYEMVEHDFKDASRDVVCNTSGFSIPASWEANM